MKYTRRFILIPCGRKDEEENTYKYRYPSTCNASFNCSSTQKQKQKQKQDFVIRYDEGDGYHAYFTRPRRLPRPCSFGFRLMFRDSFVHIHEDISFDHHRRFSRPRPDASSVASRHPKLSRSNPNPTPDIVPSEKKTKTKKRNSELIAGSVTTSDIVQDPPVPSEEETKKKKGNSELLANSVTTNPSPTSDDVVQAAPVPSEEDEKTKKKKRNSELFASWVTTNPNPTADAVQEAPVPSEEETKKKKKRNLELFAGSVTTNRSPSPSDVPIPMFFLRERIKLSNPRFDVKKDKRAYQLFILYCLLVVLVSS
ncbi:PREDICTED: uncharacterized protein LOC104804418 [Tarenaya hassleriana]|uniref:uncharacterized protein LOC104804418 n=1 Tax=Tarenaya hassleriana TaxID=28532 RepID=UPI00053C7047|nr:PREDICTED: uncharacterized protein LOC104804418 [Tarenaya hassleriana]